MAMGFFFGIVAGLVFKDFIGHAYAVLDEHLNPANALFTVAVGVFLMLQLLNGYLYYQYFEFYPVSGEPISWRTYCGFIFNNIMKAGILFFCYGAVHQADTKYIEKATGAYARGSVAAFLLNVAAVEILWLLWDISYFVSRLRFTRSLWKDVKALLADSEPGVSATRRWTILNFIWAAVMTFVAYVLMLYVPAYSQAIAILVAALLASYSISYLVLMKDYYSGQIAAQAQIDRRETPAA
jgi:hypothetical protein